MNFKVYNQQFDAILNGEITKAPYDNNAFVNYVKLNQGRIHRWYKKGELLPELVEAINSISSPQTWVYITEPWCGDAAHAQAFIQMASDLNPMIKVEVQNRDNGSEIDAYLTNGGKSVPKLIVRNNEGKDLFEWGPRPKEAQELFYRIKDDASMTMDDKKIALQQWYNKDKGQSMQQELLNLFLRSSSFSK